MEIEPLVRSAASGTGRKRFQSKEEFDARSSGGGGR